MPKTVTQSTSGGNVTVTTEINGVRSTTTVPVTPSVTNGNIVAKTAYKQHKIWNPNTSAYLTVVMTGNEAQDASLLAAAFVTAGVRTDSIISTT